MRNMKVTEIKGFILAVVQLLSCIRIFEIPMDCSTPGFPVPHHLPEFAQIHVHWIRDAIQPSHPLPPTFPFAFNLPQYQGLFQWVSFSHQVAKYWSFSISHSNEYSGLITLRIEWLDLLSVQGTLKILLQHHSSKPSILQDLAFFIVRVSHPHMTTGKPQLWLGGLLLAKWCLCFLICCLGLSYSLPSKEQESSNSWLQSPSAVILEPKQWECHHFHFSPFYLPWSDGTKCHDLSFLNVEF